MCVALRIPIVAPHIAAGAALAIALLSSNAVLAQVSPRPASADSTLVTTVMPMSVEDARAILRNATGNLVILRDAKGSLVSEPSKVHINGIAVTDDQELVFISSHGDRRPTISLSAVTRVRIEIHDATHEAVCFNVDCTVAVYSMSPNLAEKVANALAALTRSIERPESQEERLEFEAQASSYRDAPVKPIPGEDVRRLRIQAEAAVNEKRFQDAADLYAKALYIAPWWPEGHFNAALILGDLHQYDKAIHHLQKYLLLVPNAQDARAAQDKIYAWEGEKAAH
jgi:tetratricopeptide (TPR) repeat protein